MSPVAKPRETLEQQLPKFFSQIKEGKKPFAPTPKLSQSIDVSRFKGAVMQKYKLEDEFRTIEHQAARDDERFGRAMQLQHAQYKQDDADSKIFLTKEFQETMAGITKQHNEALADFNQYFEVMTDLERSPFVPTHIAKVRRVKAQEAKQLAGQAKIREKWEKRQ